MKRWACALAVSIPLLYGTYAEYLSASRKFRMIDSDQLRRTHVMITSGELNAWVKQEIAATYPQGVRDPRVVLADGGGTGSLVIDFGKVRRAQGNPPGWLMSKLIDGERPVEVTVRLRSGSGRCKVDVTSVKVSGYAIEGRVLDFLIHYYLLPNYPDAKVGEPFELAHGIDRLDVKPGAVDVVIR